MRAPQFILALCMAARAAARDERPSRPAKHRHQASRPSRTRARLGRDHRRPAKILAPLKGLGEPEPDRRRKWIGVQRYPPAIGSRSACSDAASLGELTRSGARSARIHAHRQVPPKTRQLREAGRSTRHAPASGRIVPATAPRRKKRRVNSTTPGCPGAWRAWSRAVMLFAVEFCRVAFSSQRRRDATTGRRDTCCSFSRRGLRRVFPVVLLRGGKTLAMKRGASGWWADTVKHCFDSPGDVLVPTLSRSCGASSTAIGSSCTIASPAHGLCQATSAARPTTS